MKTSHEIMYDLSSIVIVVILFALIQIAYEIGYRVGGWRKRQADSDTKTQTGTIQAATLGLLALLLGFTFNMALQRFDNRSLAEIHEANTVGTTILRTQLLPSPYDSTLNNLLQKYVDLRLKISTVDLTRVEQRSKINRETEEIQGRIWDQAIKAVDLDPRPVTTGYFIISLNEMIDARGKRNAILKRHIPEVILILLFMVFVLTGSLLGYAGGQALQRAYIPTIMITLMIVMVIFIVIDLDRPKRGIIKVKQDNMLELKTTVHW